jgi:ribosomal protein S18 acetylase RimI-like enzyme
MNAHDWRHLSARQMAPLYEAERQRWLTDLHWDYSSTLADIERARESGQLPGFVVLDGARIAGWSYHLLHRDTLQIGGVIASSASATSRLFEATMKSNEAMAATSNMAFGFFDAPGLDQLLSGAGFAFEPYSYFERGLDRSTLPAAATDVFLYDAARTGESATLLQHAYRDGQPRPFARTGSADEWLEYLSQLIHADGCGAFAPEASLVSVDPNGRVEGLALTSRVSQTTAHLCQLAVHPAAQGRKRGAELLRRVCAAAKQHGSARMTLLVASSNTAARRLYSRFGFVETARFIFATR